MNYVRFKSNFNNVKFDSKASANRCAPFSEILFPKIFRLNMFLHLKKVYLTNLFEKEID